VKVTFLLPALTEAVSPYFRPIKYSLFPPLGLATLAAYLDKGDEADIQDEHVEALRLDGRPDVVAIEVYITAARRAYEVADHYRRRGVHVCLGGLHVTALPEEAAAHADTVFLGPGEDTWPQFLADFRAGQPRPVYRSTVRTLADMPRARRDLIKRHLYLAPNTVMVSRGCPHHCDFCYKDAFFQGGKSFYVQPVDQALTEIGRLPGRHLFFVDDNLFADFAFAEALFDGMRGMGRLFQAAGTVPAILSRPDLVERAAEAGLRSLFVGFETLQAQNLRSVNKAQTPGADYTSVIRRLQSLGVMVNASFVFGLDGDDETVFDRTVDWAVEQGIETATFHILTPYPGTPLHKRFAESGRLVTQDWSLYDTRHTVFRPARMSAEALEAGYWRAYEQFYRWRNILSAANTKPALVDKFRHIAYAGGWKKIEPVWNLAIKARRIAAAVPLLEATLAGFGRYSAKVQAWGGSLPAGLRFPGCD
jgi:radical SAM superfamily enzyme YgiQ (UPF0313 family)